MLAKRLSMCLCLCSGIFIIPSLFLAALSGCAEVSSSSSKSPPQRSLSSAPFLAPAFPQKIHKIALLLPQTGDLKNAGAAIQAGFINAYQGINPNDKPTIKIYDESVSFQSHYVQAVNEGAEYIVGPLDKNKVSELENSGNIKNLVIVLNHSNHSDSVRFNPNIYTFALSPADEARAIADKAIQDGYRKALLITPAGLWGQNIAAALQRRFQEKGGVITQNAAVNNSENINDQIQAFLKRRNFETIFMIVQPSKARQIKALIKYYENQITPVYSTSIIYSGLVDQARDQDLNGVIFCDMPLTLDQTGPWAALRQNKVFSEPAAIQQYIRLFGLGWDAAFLTQDFKKMSQEFWGATGRLSLGADNTIIRQPKFAVFKNGLAEVIA